MKLIASVLPALSGFLMLTSPAHAEENIMGLWQTAGETSTVEITRSDEGWIGRIVALKDPLTPEGKVKTDYRNPDPRRRKDPIIGLRILWGFKADGANRWDKGHVYDPENGKTYHASITLKNAQLRLRGSLDPWGIAGRSATWSRRPEGKTP